MLTNILEQLLGTVKKEETLEEKAGAFSVVINSLHKGNRLLALAKRNGLSIPRVEQVVNVEYSSLAFFFEGEKDVNVITTALENVVRDLVPRYEINDGLIDDYWEVRDLIRIAGQKKKELRKKLKVKGRTYLELLAIQKQRKETITTLVDMLSGQYCPCAQQADTYLEVAPHYAQVDNMIIPKGPNDVVVFEIN